jgi:AcrR family transcriptional regulator
MTDTDEESGWSRRRNALLETYEQVAWQLFAEQGFREVTVDEIAEAAGVSARTLFRYFPTKEEFLLGFTRRVSQPLLHHIGRLEPSPFPLQAVWQLMRDRSLENPDARLLTLWRRAAADAPEIHVHDLTEAVTAYCARSLGVDGVADPRPRLLAGVVVGVEMAVAELWGRSAVTLPEILEMAETVLVGWVDHDGRGQVRVGDFANS